MRFTRVLSLVAAFAVSIVAGAVAAAGPQSAAAGAPTFTKDVAPILYKSCIECHRATMFAPMPSARDAMMTNVAPGLRPRVRSACRTPCRSECIPLVISAHGET